MNETMVTVVGNVTTDPTARRVGAEGHLVVGFRVASSERRYDRATESWMDGDRFSAWVSCWRRLGDGVVTSLVKGDPVVVTGRLSTREYEVNGERRYATDIAATSVGPDLARSSAKVMRRRPATVEDADKDVSTASDEASPATGTDEAGSTDRVASPEPAAGPDTDRGEEEPVTLPVSA